MIQGLNPGGGRFSSPAQTSPGPTHPPVQWIPGLFPGVKRPGHGVDHPPLYSTNIKERGDLYLYSPSAFMACYRVNFTFICTLGVMAHCLLSHWKLIENIYMAASFNLQSKPNSNLHVFQRPTVYMFEELKIKGRLHCFHFVQVPVSISII